METFPLLQRPAKTTFKIAGSDVRKRRKKNERKPKPRTTGDSNHIVTTRTDVLKSKRKVEHKRKDCKLQHPPSISLAIYFLPILHENYSPQS